MSSETTPLPRDEYQRRLEQRRSVHERLRGVSDRLSTARGVAFLAAVALIALASAFSLVPAWTILLPVVVFVGDATLRTAMPDHVLTRGLLPWIKRHQAIKLDEATRLQVIQRIEELERTTDRKAAARAHVAALST